MSQLARIEARGANQILGLGCEGIVQWGTKQGYNMDTNNMLDIQIEQLSARSLMFTFEFKDNPSALWKIIMGYDEDIWLPEPNQVFAFNDDELHLADLPE